MEAAGPPLRSIAETSEVLGRPWALEDIGLSAVPCLATVLDAGDGTTPAQREALVDRLLSVRAVTVGVLRDDPPAPLAALADAFDIVVGPPGLGGDAVVQAAEPARAIAAISAGVAANPHAAVALAELLRLRAYERVPQALVLESLTYSTLQSGPEFAAWLASRGPAELPPDAEPPIIVERHPSSLELTLNRPHRANAFTAAMRDLLVESLRTAAADPLVDGVVIRGAGTAFCSGGDLAEFGSAPDPATAHATRLVRSPAWWIHHLSSGVRVHLHGACVGAGIELPAFAGTVIADPGTTIRLPEVAMGLVPGAGGTVSLPRRIGRQRTAYLAVTGATIDASQALAWGLVDAVRAPR